WRVNAWCEVVAMVGSFLLSVGFLVFEKQGLFATSSATRLVLTVIATTICWVLAAYLAPPTDRETLLAFYRTVKPAGPGWAPIRAEAGLTPDQLAATGDSLPLALLGWVAGCTSIWASLFTVGNFLYGRTGMAWFLLAVFVVSSGVLIFLINRLWSPRKA
ncbi:MAG: Na+:solute symporter, partial [Blastocatellia bacterium]